MSRGNNVYTADKAADVLVVEQIGHSRYRTPDGYLYCEGVRIASTKPLLYRAEEMKKVRSKHGMVLMERTPEVLFSKDTLASFNGKPVTNSHPQTLVNPKTWKKTNVGTVLNPRAGTGDDAGYMVADIIIADEQAIKDVEDGKVEVSCGYDQDHEEIQPGHGRFTRITGNHVALVEKGRCGPQCAIKDEDTNMASNMIERLRNAFKDKDESAFDAEVEHVETALKAEEQKVVIELAGATQDANGALVKIMEALDSINGRLEKLETKDMKEDKEDKEEKEEKEEEVKDEKECPPEEKEKEMKDAALDAMTVNALRLEFQEVVSKAEILSPGIRVPTFDATAKSKQTIADQMCGLRKSAMEKALMDEKRSTFVTKITGDKPDLETMDCATLTMAFNASTELARAANNAPRVAMDHMMFPSGPMTAEKLQKLNESRRRKSA